MRPGFCQIAFLRTVQKAVFLFVLIAVFYLQILSAPTIDYGFPVEMRGFEPLTSAVQGRRSPS